ncbi:MAG TPA: serine protease [Ideonella sp.]|jgi:S1-C subfamily serine protease|nr:serine protease [Ideonella sp.]
MPLIDPLLLATARLSTFSGATGLTNASGFFFRRDERLYLVSSRHVFIDEDSGHRPDRLELELHLDPDNVTQSTGLSVLLYQDGLAVWRQGRDQDSEIDVAVMEIDQAALPKGLAIRAFSPRHLAAEDDEVTIGQTLLIPGFPLGFHDAVHHLPVVRHAIVASPWGLRFQGRGYFLTDARTHRGSSGAPVALRAVDEALRDDELPWRLLGIHSSRMDMGDRDPVVDESLGLNISWYPDILLTLTAPPPDAADT